MKLLTLALNILFLTANTVLLAQPPVTDYQNTSSTETKRDNKNVKPDIKEAIAKVILCNGAIITQQTR